MFAPPKKNPLHKLPLHRRALGIQVHRLISPRFPLPNPHERSPELDQRSKKMRKTSRLFLGLSLAVSGVTFAAAQDQASATMQPPKYLQITVEYTRPGKGGLAHDKTEGAFVQAMTKAKFPINYWAYNSMSGKPRTLYISGFDSFSDLGKANKIFEGQGVAATFEPLNVADGELLEDSKQIIFSFDGDLSLRPGVDLLHHRFLEADIVHVRQGHGKEFRELAKMWVDQYGKAGASAHWDAFQAEYGEDGGYVVFLVADKSLDDVDTGFAIGKTYSASLSDGDKKKMAELRAASIDEDRTELYSVNPAQSYVPEAFIKADPGYWKPKSGAAAKPAAKPATDDKKTKP